MGPQHPEHGRQPDAAIRIRSTLNTYSQNGIANANAPINALVGVFLDDKQPNMSATPPGLDFSTAASRDFDTIGGSESGGTVQNQPLKLKQIFFIGDGPNSKGVKQSFIAPKGATRLFLATWDFYEWNNNAGFRNIQITRPGKDRPRQVVLIQPILPTGADHSSPPRFSFAPTLR